MSSEEIPLKPLGKEDIRKLESALLTMVLFSRETFEELQNPHGRLTWVDSLYTAAAALARSKAGMSLSQIADEIGVTEATLRRHLRGETKAGQLVLKAYERLSKEGFKVELPIAVSAMQSEELTRLREKLSKVRDLLKQAMDELSAI
ncbi:MAG: regulator [Caldivirga sp.]|jgi:Predicted transcriptional regulators|uniref:helix-turn-helix domain-containing protein n=1 Tax=Caldivirga sp. MU80 TaxID=1650354 RepID=UPI00074A11CA|nr:regulator [Caldivirga sp. MU80]KUO85884.1 MAG: regulator [Caldivirga sp. CIS_19]MDT7902864.1 regulator [Caldivirga sp.]